MLALVAVVERWTRLALAIWIAGTNACGGQTAAGKTGSKRADASPSGALSSSSSTFASGPASASSVLPGTGSNCMLGGQCYPTEGCAGGVTGCPGQCQCLSGTWQAPCPDALPVTGSACTAPGATCGYAGPSLPSDSEDCYCLDGGWYCSPTGVSTSTTLASSSTALLGDAAVKQ